MKYLKTLGEIEKYITDKMDNYDHSAPYSYVSNSAWSRSDNLDLSAIIDFASISSSSEEEILSIDNFLTAQWKSESDIFSYYALRGDTRLGIFMHLINASSVSIDDFDIFDKILRLKTSSNKIKYFLLKNCYYTTPKMIDEMSESDSKAILQHVAMFCSYNKLLMLKDHKWAEIRNIAYLRLGPIDYMDEMLLDKGKNVRMRALEVCPPFYKTLSKLSGERANWLVQLVALKMPIKDLPFLLGNKVLNEKKSWVTKRVSNIIQLRLQKASLINSLNSKK